MRVAPLTSMRLLTMAIAAALSCPTAAGSRDIASASSPLISRHLVDIGNGRRMNILCLGRGSPTVIFEYGLGGHLLNWKMVQPPLSALTTTCFYDRAGYGESDPSRRPMTAQNVTDDLYWLLRKAGVATPVVLVGHSLGGLYGTLYTDRFPSDVAGLVLLDPAFAGQDLDETPEEQQRAAAVYSDSRKWMRNCAGAARDRRATDNTAACIPTVRGLTQEEITWVTQQSLKPARWDAMLSESQNLHTPGALSEDEKEEQRAAISFGKKSLIVFTAGVAPKQPDESEDEHRKNMAHWKAGHDRLAARSSRGQSILAVGATHMIQLDRPDLVIEAVQKVVLSVRGSEAAPNSGADMPK